MTASRIPTAPIRAGRSTSPVVDYEPPPVGGHAPPARADAGRAAPTHAAPAAAGPPAVHLSEPPPPRAAAVFADAALRRVLEVIDRRRPVAQLRPLLAPALIDTVIALSRIARRRRRQCAPSRSCAGCDCAWSTAPKDDSAEVFGTYTRGPRVRALAARIELIETAGASSPCRSVESPAVRARR